MKMMPDKTKSTVRLETWRKSQTSRLQPYTRTPMTRKLTEAIIAMKIPEFTIPSQILSPLSRIMKFILLLHSIP